MAAYNCGPLNVEKAVARTGYADFWELRRRNVLPRETSNYVPIILAMAIMSKNPAHYGLEGIEVEPPLEYSTVVLEAATHLDLIADITGQPVAELRVMNPALLTNVAPAGYALHVPAGGGARWSRRWTSSPQPAALPGACTASPRETPSRRSPAVIAQRPSGLQPRIRPAWRT